jgi:hypothetical protein
MIAFGIIVANAVLLEVADGEVVEDGVDVADKNKKTNGDQDSSSLF